MFKPIRPGRAESAPDFNLQELPGYLSNIYQQNFVTSTKIYRIYPCIMHTFFSQILPLKQRYELYTDPFVFMLGTLHNNTKSAKSNNSQFYATSRNKSRQKFV